MKAANQSPADLAIYNSFANFADLLALIFDPET